MPSLRIPIAENTWTSLGGDTHELLVLADADFEFAFTATAPAASFTGYTRAAGEELVTLPPTGMNLYVRNRERAFSVLVTQGEPRA